MYVVSKGNYLDPDEMVKHLLLLHASVSINWRMVTLFNIVHCNTYIVSTRLWYFANAFEGGCLELLAALRAMHVII